MLLKRIQLQNIRSYISEDMVFSEGTTLLSGDIGSGKSTILLSVEFALFGLMRGALSGEHLLRQGKKEGSVTLTISVEGREITIHRVLRRQKDRAVQAVGHIIENGIRKDCTPVEMKAFIFGILQYPGDLLGKGANLIYRYTVYTPQEDMKKILLDDEESRLHVLRNVFGVDKYRRIHQNSRTYARELKARSDVLSGKLERLPEIEETLLRKKNLLSIMEQKIEELKHIMESAGKRAQEKLEIVEKQEAELRKLQEERHRFDLVSTELRHLVQQENEKSRLLERFRKELIEIPLENTEIRQDEINARLQKAVEEISKKRAELQRIEESIAHLTARTAHAKDVVRSIQQLDECGVCQQPVEEEHKRNIFERENRKCRAYEDEINRIKEQKKIAQSHFELLQQERELCHKQAGQYELAILRKKQREEKQNIIARLESDLLNIARKIQAKERQKQEIKVRQDKELESTYAAHKKELLELQSRERTAAMHFAAQKKEEETLGQAINELDKEKEKLLGLRKEQLRIRNQAEWIESTFAPLMGVMEKHVFSKAYSNFSSLFLEWFSALAGEETLTAGLDETFSPVILQNGYEMPLNSLSGGEKTSCALAYRLALNRVINDLMCTIKTRDLLILDEPTDGFSSEQLDNMRDVLSSLKIRQVIIVSHEKKIESFVDSAIRISKEGHVSRIAG